MALRPTWTLARAQEGPEPAGAGAAGRRRGAGELIQGACPGVEGVGGPYAEVNAQNPG